MAKKHKQLAAACARAARWIKVQPPATTECDEYEPDSPSEHEWSDNECLCELEDDRFEENLRDIRAEVEALRLGPSQSFSLTFSNKSHASRKSSKKLVTSAFSCQGSIEFVNSTFIEYFWGKVKKYLRDNCDGTFGTLKTNMPLAIQSARCNLVPGTWLDGGILRLARSAWINSFWVCKSLT
jgi:hypothetical protein